MNILINFSVMFILLFFTSTIHYAKADPLYHSGFQELKLDDDTRPLLMVIWYPTLDQAPTEKIGANTIFEGEDAIINASIIEGTHPLIIISHGVGGSWQNQAWLASALSKRGYIVVSPNHPGTSVGNMNRLIAQNMLERPNDISRVTNYILANSKFSDHFNINNIAVIGHSYGGWTAMEIIGGQFSNKLFTDACLIHPYSASCHIYNQQMQGLSANSDYLKLDKKRQDPRIKAAIVLDVSFAYGFTPTSLKKINIPTLIISALSEKQNSADESESRYLINYLPPKTTQYIVIDGASHFSFIGVCKPDAKDLLEKQSPKESIICEKEKRERRIIHQQIIDDISIWLDDLIID